MKWRPILRALPCRAVRLIARIPLLDVGAMTPTGPALLSRRHILGGGALAETIHTADEKQVLTSAMLNITSLIIPSDEPRCEVKL